MNWRLLAVTFVASVAVGFGAAALRAAIRRRREISAREEGN